MYIILKKKFCENGETSFTYYLGIVYVFYFLVLRQRVI